MVVQEDLNVLRGGQNGNTGVLVGNKGEVNVLPVTLHLLQSLKHHHHHHHQTDTKTIIQVFKAEGDLTLLLVGLSSEDLGFIIISIRGI